jgi:methylated-DNA-protein-cysteine methyltransferase related protein
MPGREPAGAAPTAAVMPASGAVNLTSRWGPDQWGAAEDQQERWQEGGKMTAYARIYSIVARIPRGKVATYGQIAALAGIPRQARKVGRALHALPLGSDVPWQRVINAKAEISRRKRSEAHLLQRQLLEEEGIVFDEHGRLNFKQFRWRP